MNALDFLGELPDDVEAVGTGGKLMTLDEVVMLKGTYITHFFKQDVPSTVNRIRKRISNLQHALGRSKHHVLVAILEAGLSSLEYQIERGKHGIIVEPDTQLYADWQTAKELTRIDNDRCIFSMWEEIYKERGAAGFVQWATDVGYDKDLIERFASKYVPEEKKRVESEREWLWKFLERSGYEAKTSVIKKAAIDEGIIKEDDWNRIEKIAERCSDIRKLHGVWKLDKPPF